MPLPLSASAINRLGKRLAAASEQAEPDLDLLEQVVQCHADILMPAKQRIDKVIQTVGLTDLAVSFRAKTTQTIIEKLRHQPNMPLARMQDLAGIRIVGSITLDQQDVLAAKIEEGFPADPREPRIVDRRATPSWGYRAVHVVVSLDGVSVEVQVRTQWQHLWANLTERLGDELGRGIRYGEQVGRSSSAMEALVDGLAVLSDQLYQIELDVASGRTVVVADQANNEALRTFMLQVLPDAPG